MSGPEDTAAPLWRGREWLPEDEVRADAALAGLATARMAEEVLALRALLRDVVGEQDALGAQGWSDMGRQVAARDEARRVLAPKGGDE